LLSVSSHENHEPQSARKEQQSGGQRKAGASRPRDSRRDAGATLEYSAGPALQHFHGLLQLIIDRVLGLGFLIGSGCTVFVIRTHGIVGDVSH
jgi:hypothetical protein